MLKKTRYRHTAYATGYLQDTCRILAGYSQDTRRILTGYSQYTSRTLAGYLQDTGRILVGYLQVGIYNRIFTDYFQKKTDQTWHFLSSA